MNEPEEITTPSPPNSWEGEAALTCAGPVWAFLVFCSCFSHASVSANGLLRRSSGFLLAANKRTKFEITARFKPGRRAAVSIRPSHPLHPLHPLHPRPVLAGAGTEDILSIRFLMPLRHWAQMIHRTAGAIMGKQYKKVAKRARRKQYIARVKARQRQAQKDRNSS